MRAAERPGRCRPAPPVTGVRRAGLGVEVEQTAEDDAGAGTGVGGQGQGLLLGEQRAVGVVGDEEGGLLVGRDDGGLGGCGVFSCEEALMGALPQMPENAAHDERGGEQYEEEDLLIAGDHGWRTPVRSGSERQARIAAARAAATRAW